MIGLLLAAMLTQSAATDIIFGDSLAVGLCYGLQVNGVNASCKGTAIVGAGVGHPTSWSDWVDVLDKKITPNVSKLWIEIGTNDSNDDFAGYVAELSFLRDTLSRDVKVIWVEPAPICRNHHVYRQTIHFAIKAVADSYRDVYLTNPATCDDRQDDGIHFTNQGYVNNAQELLQQMRNYNASKE